MTSDQISAKAWKMVGESFRMAMEQVEEATKQPRRKKWQP
jgi:hypothetical protein